MYFTKRYIIVTLHCNTLKKYEVKTNPKMSILMYFKVQSDQPRITGNAFKKSNFPFAKSASMI